jgi:hypothetical protein
VESLGAWREAWRAAGASAHSVRSTLRLRRMVPGSKCGMRSTAPHFTSESSPHGVRISPLHVLLIVSGTKIPHFRKLPTHIHGISLFILAVAPAPTHLTLAGPSTPPDTLPRVPWQRRLRVSRGALPRHQDQWQSESLSPQCPHNFAPRQCLWLGPGSSDASHQSYGYLCLLAWHTHTQHHLSACAHLSSILTCHCAAKQDSQEAGKGWKLACPRDGARSRHYLGLCPRGGGRHPAPLFVDESPLYR